MTDSEIKRWFPDSMPAPIVDQHTLPWWEACAEQRLTAQRCTACNHTQHPPAPICSECHGRDFDMSELNGKGILYTYTAVHQPIAMEQTLPFIIAVVELDMTGTDCKNPIRIMTNIVDAAPESLEIGQAVVVAWEKMSDFVSIPRFRVLA